MEDRKRLVQIAYRVEDALARLKHNRYSELAKRLASTVGQFQQLNDESRKMGAALTHGWLAAAERCRSRTSMLLNDLSYSISRVQQLTGAPRKKTPQLSLVVEELEQLQDEFGSIEFEKAENTVSVVTEPITLEDVPLGPFRIQLELNELSELYHSSPYRVIALEPNPAATDDAVTHPHVNSERLCEGEGCAAIRAAIEEGRICDFFTIVRSILNTYSPDSPYVSLQDWDGRACYECGYTMSSEETYYCHHCEYDYCSECSTYCRRCEETVCLGCSGQCSHCEEMLCRNCLSGCEKCGELFCQSCLEDDLCPNCKEETEKENERQETEINECENTSQPQAETTEIKLAS